MIEKEFMKLNKKYRIISCFNEDLTKSDGSLMMIAKDFKSVIYPINEKECCLLTWKNKKFVEAIDIPFESCEIDNKEKFINFKNEYLEEMCKLCDMKTSSKQTVSPSNIANVSYYLRVMKNVSSNYGDKLKEFMKNKKKVKPQVEPDGIVGSIISKQRIIQINKNGSIMISLPNGKKKLLTILESKKLLKEA